MYAVAMSRIEAEEALALDGSLVGAGGLHLEEAGRARYIDALERRRAGSRRAKRATRQTFEAMGVPVRLEPAAADDETGKGGEK